MGEVKISEEFSFPFERKDIGLDNQNIYDYYESYAKVLDSQDPLMQYRDRFVIPKIGDSEIAYFTGNSLGLQPKSLRSHLEKVLQKWETVAVEGWFLQPDPWLEMDKEIATRMAPIVGAKPSEVVAMNSLTVNLHQMLTYFYRPNNQRYKIIVEAAAFPSDMIALKSQIALHGFDPSDAMVIISPKAGEHFLDDSEILETIRTNGEKVALVCLSGVNYYTGQVFDMKRITEVGHEMGCVVGFDLAHAAGNIPLRLHDWNVDFAVWCTYKYLNAGPGGIGACFVHEEHTNGSESRERPWLSGWWGDHLQTRFLMQPDLHPAPGALRFQTSTPPILLLSSLEASLDIYTEVGMEAFRGKSEKLTGFLIHLLERLEEKFSKDVIRIITPTDTVAKRGCQVSLILHPKVKAKKMVQTLIEKKGVFTDYRDPDCIRMAPNPLYNTFHEVVRLVSGIERYLSRCE